MTAFDRARAGEPGRATSGAGPSWERLLEGDETTAPTVPVALLIEWRRSPAGPITLPMRPLTESSQGRWVRTGASWRDVRSPDGRFRGPAGDLLREILRLATADDEPRTPSTIELTTFPSARIWAVLAAAESAGLTLLSDDRGGDVVLAREPGQAAIDVTTHADGAWALSGELRVGPHPVDVATALIGQPAHGFAYLARSSLPSITGAMHLVPLAEPLDAAARDLVELPRPVIVPAADTDRFVRDYLPRLRRRMPVTSRDESAPLPGSAELRLVAAVARDDIGMVVVTWRWRYIWADEAIDIPLELPAQPELRDLDREQSLAAEVLAACAPLPVLYRRVGAGRALLPRALLSQAQALRFARDVLPTLRGTDGVIVDISEGALDFREAISPPVVAMAGSLTPEKDWLELAVTVTVDGEEVPFAELFRALAAGAPSLMLPSGTYFSLDTPALTRLRELIVESYALGDRDPVQQGSLRVSRYEAAFWDAMEAMGVLDEQALAWSAAVRALAGAAGSALPGSGAAGSALPGSTAAPPVGLTAELRPYQLAGYRWLTFLEQHGLGGVLADDMGLGKTLQALAMVLAARRREPSAPPFLVVAPTSVVSGWVEEARRFAPGLDVRAVTATAAGRDPDLADLAGLAAGADVVVTSYALFRLEYADYAALGWSGLLLDEAQQIKNHHSQTYRCARSLAVPVTFAITGTPLENNLMELWAMYSVVAPGLLGEPKRFTEHYRNPIERNQDADRLATLRRRIRPLLLRRTKADVAPELPPKIEQVLELELDPAHRRAYDRFLARERRKVLGLLGEMDRNRFQIFRSLTLLRQAALDVALVGEETGPGGHDSGGSGGSGPDGPGSHGSGPSTKLDALVELVTSAAAEGHRVLVFSQFIRFLRRAQARFDLLGIGTCYLDGSTRHRAEVLREFREGDAPAFLISLKAGGVGLNLAEADYCVLTDPWWNPATEAQAVDRSHRIGQRRPVMVYRLVARDTIEQKVMALKARKAALFDAMLTEGGVGATGLTAADIRALLH